MSNQIIIHKGVFFYKLEQLCHVSQIPSALSSDIIICRQTKKKIILFFFFFLLLLAQSLVLYLQLPVLRLSFNDDVLE